MIAEHLDAIEKLLRAEGVRVHREPPQDVQTRRASDFPYVVLYSDPGARSSSRMMTGAHRADFIVQTTLVSLNYASVNGERDFVVKALAQRRPVVAGRRCSVITHLPGPHPSRDGDIPDRTVVTAFDRWSFYSLADNS